MAGSLASFWQSFEKKLFCNSLLDLRATRKPAMATCVEIKFQAPHDHEELALRRCVCSMTWSFQAIDATLSP